LPTGKGGAGDELAMLLEIPTVPVVGFRRDEVLLLGKGGAIEDKIGVPKTLVPEADGRGRVDKPRVVEKFPREYGGVIEGCVLTLVSLGPVVMPIGLEVFPAG